MQKTAEESISVSCTLLLLLLLILHPPSPTSPPPPPPPPALPSSTPPSPAPPSLALSKQQTIRSNVLSPDLNILACWTPTVLEADEDKIRNTGTQFRILYARFLFKISFSYTNHQ